MASRLSLIGLLFSTLALIGCARSQLQCRDDLGCALIRPGEPVRIALLLSLSGETAFLGQDSQGGVEIAVDDRAGELLEHPIELVAIDSGCRTQQAEAAAEVITADAGLLGIIGPNCSDVVGVVLPAVEQAGLVMISPSTTAPELTQTGQGVYFRTAHNNLFQARIVAQYAYTVLGARRAAVIHDESAYGIALQQQFVEVFQNLGGSIVFLDVTSLEQSAVGERLTAMATDSPDVLYLALFEPEAALIASSLGEIEALADMTLLGADSLLVPTFVAGAAETVNGMLLSGPAMLAGDGSASEELADGGLANERLASQRLANQRLGSAYQTFLNKWVARYGAAPPGPFHAHAYDATGILLEAIESVAQVSNNGTLLVGRQALRQAVATTAGFEGVTGTLTCSPSGDCASGEALAIFQITSEEISGEAWPPPIVWMP